MKRSTNKILCMYFQKYRDVERGGESRGSTSRDPWVLSTFTLHTVSFRIYILQTPNSPKSFSVPNTADRMLGADV